MSADDRGRIFRFIGFAFAIACVAWIVHRFIEQDILRIFLRTNDEKGVFVRAALGMPSYLFGVCLLSVAWWCVQCSLCSASLPFGKFFSIHATTQFAKYLPGNVGHYLGRHYLARREGVSDTALVAGTLAEACLLLCAAAIWAAAGLGAALPLHMYSALERTPWYLPVSIAVIFACASVIFVSRRTWGLRRPKWLAAGLALYLAFFGCMALCLSLCIPDSAPYVPFRTIAAAAAASWMVGFVALGAPAGIGVREAMLILLLRDRIPESDALIAALSFRVATFGADLLIFLAGWASRTVFKSRSRQ